MMDLCLLGDRERSRVPAGSVGEADRTSPARGVGEHEVGTCSPARELKELRRPHDPPAPGFDDIPAGGMRGVHDGLGRQAEAVGGETAGLWHQAVRRRKLPQRG